MLYHKPIKKPTRRYANATYESRYKQGLCLKCGEGPPEAPKTLCSACLEVASRRMQARRDAKLALGLCHRCGIRPVSEGRSQIQCSTCLDRTGEANASRRQEAIEHGKCSRCRNQPPLPGHRSCENCMKYKREDQRTRRINKNANINAS